MLYEEKAKKGGILFLVPSTVSLIFFKNPMLLKERSKKKGVKEMALQRINSDKDKVICKAWHKRKVRTYPKNKYLHLKIKLAIDRSGPVMIIFLWCFDSLNEREIYVVTKNLITKRQELD